MSDISKNVIWLGKKASIHADKNIKVTHVAGNLVFFLFVNLAKNNRWVSLSTGGRLSLEEFHNTFSYLESV